MNQVRGMLMALAGAVALWRGWTLRGGVRSWEAYGLGIAALGLAAWHIVRKPKTGL